MWGYRGVPMFIYLVSAMLTYFLFKGLYKYAQKKGWTCEENAERFRVQEELKAEIKEIARRKAAHIFDNE